MGRKEAGRNGEKEPGETGKKEGRNEEKEELGRRNIGRWGEGTLENGKKEQ